MCALGTIDITGLIMYSQPLGYFITIRTYGTWLPGDERSYTHHSYDEHCSKHRDPSPGLKAYAEGLRSQEAFVLDDAGRDIATDAIRDVCEHRGWTLAALHVRSNHVHVVVQAGCKPERVINDFKSWSTRALREANAIERDRKVWARHGSTIYLFKDREVAYAVWYTDESQDGERFEMPTQG